MRVEDLMRRAIRLAAGESPHPNPRVGAVVLDAVGAVVGEGSHAGPGRPHAEVVALESAGSAGAGGTLIVTLEPCVHHGRTPPCVDAILRAGVARVIVGAQDPDERVNGLGIARLEAAGVDVSSGVLPGEVEAVDPGYFHHRRTGLPRVTWKAALTIDGQVAAADGTSQWITSVAARVDGHRLRAGSDAVMVGAGTILADDPRLTARIQGYDGPQPVAVVVAGRRALPAGAAVFTGKCLVVAPRPMDVAAEVIVAPDESGTRVDLSRALRLIAEKGLLEVLVEGGSALIGSLLADRLVDRGVFYYGARLAAGRGMAPAAGPFPTLSAAHTVRVLGVDMIEGDVRLEFEVL